MRILGLDVGTRRIGVAISDASGTLARPVKTLTITALDSRSVDLVVQEIERLGMEDDPIDGVVVGLPRRLDGSANDMTRKVEAFATQLRSQLTIPLVLQDERLTSREAESRLAVREKDWRARKAKIDSMAAAIILQDYLDSRPSISTGDA
jgi:putative Holliday junction resolvase